MNTFSGLGEGSYVATLPNGFKLAWFTEVKKYGLYSPDYWWLRTLDDEQEALELLRGLSSSKRMPPEMARATLPAEDGAPKDSRQ